MHALLRSFTFAAALLAAIPAHVASANPVPPMPTVTSAGGWVTITGGTGTWTRVGGTSSPAPSPAPAPAPPSPAPAPVAPAPAPPPPDDCRFTRFSWPIAVREAYPEIPEEIHRLRVEEHGLRDQLARATALREGLYQHAQRLKQFRDDPRFPRDMANTRARYRMAEASEQDLMARLADNKGRQGFLKGELTRLPPAQLTVLGCIAPGDAERWAIQLLRADPNRFGTEIVVR